MKKNIFSSLFISFVSLLCLPSEATIVDLDRLLNGMEQQSVVQLFKATEELHIGGTNTYGNRTTYKEGEANKLNELDPKILIINPDLNAHAKSNDIIGILGSAFDFRANPKINKGLRLSLTPIQKNLRQ